MSNNPSRGDVYRLLARGALKPRPIAIVSRNQLNNGHSILAVPFYSQQLEKRSALPWCVRFYKGEGGLEVDCVAKCDEVSLISRHDIDLAAGRMGTLSDEQLTRIEPALKWALDIG
jgi:mRNA-degrading endonuclease toxin of MazEF toxin-antitoxin module